MFAAPQSIVYRYSYTHKIYSFSQSVSNIENAVPLVVLHLVDELDTQAKDARSFVSMKKTVT